MPRALIKAIGGPGSSGFFCIGAALGLVMLMWRPTRRLGRWCFGILIATYLVLSLPVVAHGLAGTLALPSVPAAASTHIDDVFVIEGDNLRARATFAAELFRASQARTIWIVGTRLLRDELIAAGIPPDKCRSAEINEPTTFWQMKGIQDLLARSGGRRAVIVASRVQTPRVVALAQQLGLNVAVLAAPVDSEPAASGMAMWLPSSSALFLSRDALYEQFALAYYHWKGWI